MNKQVSAIVKLYKQYLGKRSLGEYLEVSKHSRSGDEETITDPLFRDMLQDPNLRKYSGDNVLLQQQRHRIEWQGKKGIAKPDFETNNEFCKTPILFDSKSSNISFEEMTSGDDTVFTTTFKRYLLAIKPAYKYILGFNLGYIFLYSKEGTDDLEVKIVVDVEKLLQGDRLELDNLQSLLDETAYKEISQEDKINILRNKQFDASPFNTELFFEKYRHTRNKLQRFLKNRLERHNIRQVDCDEYIKSDLPPSDNDDEFREQLANRLTMIEFFKYIFIRTYEDFGQIHFSKEVNDIIPVSYGAVIDHTKLNVQSNQSLFEQEQAFNDFFERYISKISKQGITDIGREFFDGFSTMFKKYEGFIEDLVLAQTAQYEYYNILFDVIFFLNEFNFKELGDDIIGGLYEKTLDREDRKKFGQFYTPRYIIDFILDTIGIKPSEHTKIADISCGTGGFLVKYLSRIKGDIIMDENKLKDIFRGTFGVDIKGFSILLTKLNIALMFILKNKALKDYNVKSKKIRLNNIIQGDGLGIQNSLPIKDDDLDFIVGNPPYIGQKGNSEIFEPIRSDQFFGKLFVKRCDLYYFFIIDGIKKLKDGGKFGYIIPREWITSDSGHKLRAYILEHCQILGIIDFNGISIFEDAGTSSCLLFLQKVSDGNSALQGGAVKHTFSFIQFKNHKGKDLVKYIDENKKNLHKKSSSKHGEAKQKVDSGHEIFSQQIFVYKTFKRIVDMVERGEKFDISRLGGLTSGKIFLNDFLDITKIKQADLGETARLFGQRIVDSERLVKLGEVLRVSAGIVTGCNSITKKHIKDGFVPKGYEGRGVFVLNEGKEIRGEGLDDIRKGKEKIGKVELNLYENGGWVELNEKEKSIIKPIFGGKDFEKWIVHKSNEFIVYMKSTMNADGIETIKKHFSVFKKILINRNIRDKKETITEEQYDNYVLGNEKINYNMIINRYQEGNYFYIGYGRVGFPFSQEKIIFMERGENTFNYNTQPFYFRTGLNSIFIDKNNEYTKIIEEKTSKRDFLKFINAVLNSSFIKKFIRTNNFNHLSVGKIRDFEIPKIDFENPEEVGRYNEIVSIANRLIELEQEDTIDISLQKKGESEQMDVHSQAFSDLMKSTDFHREDSPIGKQLVVDGEWYMVTGEFGPHPDPLLRGEGDDRVSLGEALGVVIVDDEEKEAEKKKLNARIDEIVEWWYG